MLTSKPREALVWDKRVVTENRSVFTPGNYKRYKRHAIKAWHHTSKIFM